MSETKKYCKRPVVVEAMEYGPSAKDGHAVTCWLSENSYPGLIGNALEPETLRYPDQVDGDNSQPDKGWYIDPATGDLMIRTLEGDMRTRVGDFVIRGVKGEFYPCRGEIFRETYKEANTDE